MGRTAFWLAMGLIVCVAASAAAQEHMTRSELESRFSMFENRYARAVSAGDYDAAERYWNVMREAARTLTSRGVSGYASYDRPMSRPGARPRVTPAVPEPPPTPVPPRPEAPVSVEIAPDLEIAVDAECYEPVVVGIAERQTGLEEDLTEIELEVHGRIVDRSGTRVEPVRLKIRPNVADAEVLMPNTSEFVVTLTTQGFENLQVPMDLVVTGRCIVVDPPEVSLGTVLPGEKASADFTVANTCDEPIEIVMLSGENPVFEVQDCSGGPTNLGSAVRGDDQRATLGPWARCALRVTWASDTPAVVNRSYYIGTDEGLPLDCLPSLRVMGTASDVLLVTPRELLYPGVTAVGASREIAFNVFNRSEDREVTIRGLQTYGPAENDFTLTAVTPVNTRPAGPNGQWLVLR